jgi:FkbM family methyltransferase
VRDPTEHIQSFWRRGEFYEADLLKWLYENRRGCRFIDVGACIGNHTLFALCVLDSPEVVSVEPYESNYYHLVRNIGLNRFSGKSHSLHMACGTQVGRGTMIPLASGNVGMVALRAGSQVPVTPLDSFVEPSDVPTVVKIDVEGCPLQVLQGATRLMQSGNVTWVIEASSEELPQIDRMMPGHKRLPTPFNATPTYVWVPQEKKMPRFEVGRTSLGIRHRALEGLGLTTYDPVKHRDEPCFFMGMYKQGDLDALLAHKGPALVMFCGDDARSRYVKGLAEELNKLPRPWVRTCAAPSLAASLEANGIRLDFPRNIFAGNVNLFAPRPPGRKVYCYLPYHRRSEYGLALVTEVAKEMPDVEFLLGCWGDNPLPFPNAIPLPAWLDPRMMPAVYGDCFCALRTVEADGFPTGAVECALSGLPVACRHDHGVPWLQVARDTREFVSFIKMAREGAFSNRAEEVRAYVTDTLFLDLPQECVEQMTKKKAPKVEFDRPFTGKIVGVIISNSREKEIADALKSLEPAVDGFLFIDTGIKDGTLSIARETVGADKVWVHEWPWRNDFSAARNEGLRAAADLGAEWGVFLDTDMRYEGADTIRQRLATTEVDLLYVPTKWGSAQPLVFRLPTKVLWKGRAHNWVYNQGATETLDGVQVWEIRNDPKHHLARVKQTKGILLEMLEEEGGKDPRTHFYLGEACSDLGEWDEALGYYRQCADLRGWPEEGAWACWRAANILASRKRWTDAIDEAVKGLSRHAGIAELAWMAAWANHKMGRHEQAIYWGEMAVVWADRVNEVNRVGFRNQLVLRNGAWDILYWSYKALGKTEKAAFAKTRFDELETAIKGTP